MQIQKNISLKAYNSFSIDVKAAYFVQINHSDEFPRLIEWINQHDLPFIILGGGSNILFSQDYKGLVIQINTQGKQCIKETDTDYFIEVSAGENWHQFVRWTIKQGYAGLENLSLIPGKVGAAPIQNIGAYGLELTDRFDSLKAIKISTGELQYFDKAACQFAYRDSFFKEHLDQYLIQSLVLKLPKSPDWRINYEGIKNKIGSQPLSAKLISDAIIKLRQKKLPDPNEVGNAGSFFKNPILSQAQIDILRESHPSIPSYHYADDQVKTSAAWLIDKCGWKGQSHAQAAVYAKHSLVLINKGAATGAEICQLAEMIQASVQEKFEIRLEAEPRIL
jgi:UDP-N-acetylmuramate dehydrogenase